MLIYNGETKHYDVEPVNAKNYSAWSDEGRLCFENEKLGMILTRLEN